ncbi:MAG: biopolymer transport protein ExbD [Saprospiraceae bacterium]|jgi:biopolymer transport protein ExbD
MGLKKRAKVSAEFSMSSLTDIIFLLLIFFMLTSTLVAPHALNLKQPGTGNPTTESSDPPELEISRSGTFKLNGRSISKPVDDNMVTLLSGLARRNGGKKLDLIISYERNTPVEHVVLAMDVARRLDLNGILAGEE